MTPHPHLKCLDHEIAEAIAGLSSGQLSARPFNKWSIGEILEHLYLTYTGTTKGLSRILEAGKPQSNIPSLKQKLQAFAVVRLGYFPEGRESPSQARPKGLAVEEVLGEMSSKIADLDNVMASCERRFGAGAKVLDHPILGPFSISQWRKFHLVHGRHHIKQIKRLRQDSRIQLK